MSQFYRAFLPLPAQNSLIYTGSIPDQNKDIFYFDESTEDVLFLSLFTRSAQMKISFAKQYDREEIFTRSCIVTVEKTDVMR